MLVLGLNQAHDSGVALVDDGRIVGMIQRERVTKIKRNALLTADFIEECLDWFGVSWSDIDVVGMCTSQAWPVLFADRKEFAVAIDPDLAIPGQPADLDRESVRAICNKIAKRDHHFANTVSLERYRHYFRPGAGNSEYFLEDPAGFLKDEADYLPVVEWPYYRESWLTPDIAERIRLGFGSMAGMARYNYLPAAFTLRGRTRPGLIMPHHLAHAAGAYFQSDFEGAAVHTLDNGDVMAPWQGYLGGMLVLGVGNHLHPIAPSFGYHGHFYQRVGELLGLGHGGAAGKLMGLEPYGEPRYLEHAMIGDTFKVFGEAYSRGKKEASGQVLERLTRAFQAVKDLDLPEFRRPSDHYLEGGLGAEDLRRPGIDLAATAQSVFERCTSWILATFVQETYRHISNRRIPLCLGGGGALNSPANSTIWRTLPVSDVFVPPACDDSGLPIGAALAVLHDYLDRPRVPQDSGTCASAYLGRGFDDARIRRALASGRVAVEEVGDAAADAAAAIADGRIVAWFEGRSEIGPRALGHRSILADARGADTWKRVNDLKKREYWRPFAPAVLLEDCHAWFRGCPATSPHMLFTAQVRNDQLPAITHVDGSARVQTVDRTCGGFRRVVEHFKRRTGVPVVLNTSFNGPGEPIIDTPEDAVSFVETSGIDALYIGGCRVSRLGAS